MKVNKLDRPRKRGRPRLDEVERRDRALLAHALDLFLEHGFEATTIQAITSGMGVTKRTLYARYGDKTALFRAALDSAIEDFTISAEQFRALETDDIEETLMGVARIAVEGVLSAGGMRLLRIANAISYRMPEVGMDMYRRGAREFISYLSDLFARRMGAREVPTVKREDMAEAFLNLVVGPARIAAWGFTPDPIGLEQQLRTRVSLFLDGIGAAGTAK